MPLLRLTTFPSDCAHPILFITILRTYLNLDLRAAKNLLDQFRANGTLSLTFPDPTTTRKAAEELLRHNLVSHADLITTDDPAVSVITPIPPPPPPCPIYFCLTCRTHLKHRTECPTCGWLLHPGDRTLWNTQGPCPRCGFSYRYDGTTCSHCGVDAPQPPPPPRP
jgi:hypothetical protein